MLRSEIKWLLFLFITAGIVIACGDSSKNEATKYIDSARNFIARQKPETAVLEYKNAIELYPQNDVALFELAETYILLNNVNTAIRYYNLASRANQERVEPHLRLAQIYSQIDRLMDARSEISRAMAIAPTSVNAYHILSGIQIRERDLSSAIGTLIQAQKIEPTNIKTQVFLAKLYLKTKAFDLAKSAYIKAISNDASSREAYMGLARLYAMEKKWDQVETLLLKVVKTPGITAQKYGDLAGFYEQQQKNDLAEKYFLKTIEAAPNDIFPPMAMARFYIRLNRKADAIALIEKALNTKKNIPLVLTGLSQMYLHFGEIDKAEETINKALAFDKNYVDAIFQQGVVLVAKDDYKTALDRFDQVIALNQIHAKAFYYRALCIKERGATDRPEQKIFRAAAGMLDKPEEFEKNQIKENLLAALTIDPELVEARMALATQYLLDKRADKAKEEVRFLLKLKAPDRKIMSLVAGINILEGNRSEAEKILRAIIGQHPDDLPALIRLGFLYKESGNDVKAMGLFETAFEKNPHQLGLAYEIIQLSLKAGQFGLAIRQADRFSKMVGEAEDAYFYNLKGEIYSKNKAFDQAAAYFYKSIAAKPQYIRPYMNLAGVWVHQKNMDKALAEYQTIEKIDPDFLPALWAMALTYDAGDDFASAQTYYRKVLSLDPRHPLAANNLAFLLSEDKNRLEEAFRLAKMARQIRPDDPNVLDTMGWIFYQKGNYFSALSEFEESLAKASDNPMVNYHYGMALYQTKSYEKARKFLKKALALDSQFRGAKEARKMIN
jgi:tetratricopeptide (TPR) repeat protein